MIDYIDEKKDNFMLKYKRFCSTYDADQEKGILFLDDKAFVLDAFKYLDKDDLIDFVFKDHRWHYFYTDILDNFDIVESLVQKAPEIIAITPFKYDIEKMRKIVSHEGIDPKIICYVDEAVSNDMRFITDVINSKPYERRVIIESVNGLLHLVRKYDNDTVSLYINMSEESTNISADYNEILAGLINKGEIASEGFAVLKGEKV